MKLDRNAQCLCGSGKKYKKCNLSNPGNDAEVSSLVLVSRLSENSCLKIMEL